MSEEASKCSKPQYKLKLDALVAGAHALLSDKTKSNKIWAYECDLCGEWHFTTQWRKNASTD